MMIAAVLCVVPALLIGYLAWRAPLGHEDRGGFHYERPERGDK